MMHQRRRQALAATSIAGVCLGLGSVRAQSNAVVARTGSGSPVPFGQLTDKDGNAVLTNIVGGENNGAWNISDTSTATSVGVSHNPDWVTIFDAPNGTTSEKIGFVHLESPNPSSVYALAMRQAADGTLTVTNSEPVDFSSWGGTWILCAGSYSPWNTHLGGEEYEPDARYFQEAECLTSAECGDASLEVIDEDGFGSVVSMLRFFGIYANETTPMEQVKAVFDPYKYGYVIEVTPSSTTEGAGAKWYTSGRLSIELPYVMPNNQTMYVTDDGTNVGFFRVEMDTPGDLSATTLYAAKLEQLSADNGGDFSMTWVELGSNTQEALTKAIDGGVVFSDLFETADVQESGDCPAGFTSINQGGDGQECVSLVEGQQDLAAYLEPRRLAAYLGATTEGSKWEGFVYDPFTKKAYTAISNVRYGMEDRQKKGADEPKYDAGGSNSIKLPYNKCGCVYALEFGEDFVANKFTAVLCGSPMPADEFGQECDVNSISSPDNISLLGKNILIGEDTDYHQNDFLWSWDPTTGELRRVGTTPYGSELTGVGLSRNLSGKYAYLTAVIQHPYGETDQDKLELPDATGPEGYVTAWPIAKADVASANFETVEQPISELEKAMPNFGAITTKSTDATSTVEQRAQAAETNLAAMQAEAEAKAKEEAKEEAAAVKEEAKAPATKSAGELASATVALVAAAGALLIA